ncbi:MAG: hypothetical protein NTU97_01430, partial [Candidatus Magasanikbacteria bacterium]|nr:hypothetical protein [Candidatus Magasanikbacteria bacterium]
MKSNWKTVIGAELLMTAIALGLFFGSKEFLVETWPAAATFTGYTSLLVGIAGFLIFGRSNFAWAFLTAGFMGIIGSFCSLSKIIPIFPLITFVLIIAGVALISIWKTSKR